MLATDSGRLYTYPMPPYQMKPGYEADVSNYHYGMITNVMKVSDGHLGTVGKDGTLLVYRIKAKGNRGFGLHTR